MVNANKLKARIVLAGMSQLELAKKTGMSINSLNAKVNGRKVFNCDEVQAVCDALGIRSSEEMADIFFDGPVPKMG